MTIFNEFVERRRFKRFNVSDDAFAALIPTSGKVGKILDLGEGGLSFLYIDIGSAGDGSTQIDIFVAGNKFYLPKIPVQLVSDIRIPNKIPINTVVLRRQGVQFKKMTPEQASALDSFMQQYTTGEA